jgi:hypothetical protein
MNKLTTTLTGIVLGAFAVLSSSEGSEPVGRYAKNYYCPRDGAKCISERYPFVYCPVDGSRYNLESRSRNNSEMSLSLVKKKSSYKKGEYTPPFKKRISKKQWYTVISVKKSDYVNTNGLLKKQTNLYEPKKDIAKKYMGFKVFPNFSPQLPTPQLVPTYSPRVPPAPIPTPQPAPFPPRIQPQQPQPQIQPRPQTPQPTPQPTTFPPRVQPVSIPPRVPPAPIPQQPTVFPPRVQPNPIPQEPNTFPPRVLPAPAPQQPTNFPPRG